MSKKTLLVFDIDGTLTDTVALHKTAFIHALRQLGVREIDTDFNAYRHHTDYHIAKVIFEKDTGLPFDNIQHLAFEEHLFDFISKETFMEIDGAKEMIAAVTSDTDFGICYATGSLHRPAVCKLERTGIAFDTMQLAASNGIEERENIVRTAIAQAGIFYGQEQFEEIIAVGDGLWDLLTAQRLGMGFMGVGALHRDLLAGHGAGVHLQHWQGFDRKLFNDAHVFRKHLL